MTVQRRWRRATMAAAVTVSLATLATAMPVDAATKKATAQPTSDARTRLIGGKLGAPRVSTAAGRLGPQAPTATASLVNNPAADLTNQDTQSETTAVHAGGNVVITAFNDSGSYTGSNNHFTGWSRSTDGGNTFVDQGTLPTSAVGDAGDPWLAYSKSTGTVFLATLGFSDSTQIPVFRSTNNGVSWNAPVNAFVGAPATPDLDKEAIAVDNSTNPGTGNGIVYAIVRDFGTCSCILFNRSTNDGLTWGAPIVLAQVGVAGVTALQGAYVATGPDHSVYAFYLENSGVGTNVIRVRRSTDNGLTFAAPVTVVDEATTGGNGSVPIGPMRTNGFPTAAVNPVTGQLYVVFNDLGTTVGDNADVYIVTSNNSGATWSAKTRMNHDTTTTDQFFPSVGVNAAGTALQVGWYDRRNDNANQWMQRFNNVASISGGALTFRRDWSTGPSFPAVIGQDPVINSVYMGDYDTIIDNGNGFLGTHGDNRDSNAFHTNQPDVRKYTVAFTPVTSDLGVGGSAAPATPVAVGTNVTYTFNVTRDALAGQINNVSAQFKPGTGNVQVQSAATTQGKCYINAVAGVQCQLGAMLPSASITVTVVGKAVNCGNMPIRGTVVHAGSDPNAANNAQQVLASANSACPTPINQTVVMEADCAIPDNATVNCPSSAIPNGSYSKVEIGVRIDHTFDSDLVINAVHPDSSTVVLANRVGSSGDNFGTGVDPNPCGTAGVTYTVFADSAATAITAGVAPFAGAFQPSSPLSALNGKLGGGVWNLRVQDAATLDTGTVRCWYIKFFP